MTRAVPRNLTVLWLAAAASAASCGSSEEPPAAPPQQTAPDAATPAGDSAVSGEPLLVGGFNVKLIDATGATPAYTNVSGKVYDGPSPSTVAWDTVETGGGCVLAKPRAPFCSPACGSGKLCTDDNRCVGYPSAQDLGPIKVSGLGPDFNIQPIAKDYGLPGDLMLPVPPAPEGTNVQLAVTQGPFGAFTLTTPMVAPLSSSGVVKMESGKSVVLRWSPPGAARLATIGVEVDISHHGGIKGKIECDVEDDGELEIPASMVTKLIDFGVAGFPTVTLTRYTKATARIAPGVVALTVLSQVSRPIEISGFLSCNEEMPCPTGKTCLMTYICSP